MGGSRGRVFKNKYKRHVDKIQGGSDQGWEVWMARVEGNGGGKWRQLYLNNNKKSLKK